MRAKLRWKPGLMSPRHGSDTRATISHNVPAARNVDRTACTVRQAEAGVGPSALSGRAGRGRAGHGLLSGRVGQALTTFRARAGRPRESVTLTSERAVGSSSTRRHKAVLRGAHTVPARRSCMSACCLQSSECRFFPVSMQAPAGGVLQHAFRHGQTLPPPPTHAWGPCGPGGVCVD